MKKKKKRSGLVKKVVAVTLAAMITVTSFDVGAFGMRAKAMSVTGTAPFINTWLVAGPSDTSVIAEIYSKGKNGYEVNPQALPESNNSGSEETEEYRDLPETEDDVIVEEKQETEDTVKVEETKETGDTEETEQTKEIEDTGVTEQTQIGLMQGNSGITPILGEEFGSSGTRWQYFDDRIFNRNTDDWQDLYGYFTVKQGLDVQNKYTYAHTYVYSDREQDVQLQFVTSGLHKVYVNDVLADENKNAVESSEKDKYKTGISLHKGWNKILFEIKHDRVYYLGFYARISDENGNEIPGLSYSVEGDTVSQLQITTRGLDIDREAFEERNQDLTANRYPENEMPYGYTESPYVWNKAIHRTNAKEGPQASKFGFQAAGGSPGYEWEITAGSLPDGLTMDQAGNIEGFCEKEGEYPFTVQVKDARSQTAVKEMKIIVKERPSKWFEEGKMSALSHDTGAYTQFWDPNFSFDTWAERAKKAGMTMLSTEAVQGVYYWPAPGAYPGDPNGASVNQHPNTLELNEDGQAQPKDMLQEAKEAVERHGMRFGLYYASEGSNQTKDPRVNNSSGFFQNVEDLMIRYDPKYLFFDGNPEGKGNTDAMWSAVRAYNDYTLIQANDRNEVSDNDLTILETEYTGKMPYVHGGHWETNMWNQNKYTVEEAWSHPIIDEMDAWSVYADGHTRDDWRLWAEFIVNNIGHGIVPNYDQMIIAIRGVDWAGKNYSSGIKDAYYQGPLNTQRFLEIRDHVNLWLANDGKPDLHESLFGTMPYYFDTYEQKEGYHENTEKEPFLTAKYGEGPEWGYSVERDQFVYMHMIENTIGNGRAKTGFNGQEHIYVGPFDDNVTNVEWLNEGKTLPYHTETKDGKNYITIDTTSVKEDPVDTIIKITTDDDSRRFKLTGVKLFSSQEHSTELKLRAESYLKNFTNVFADANLIYSSEDPDVASVDQNGLVTAGHPGNTTIRVTAEYEGETAVDTYHVQVKEDGTISPNEELVGVVLRTDGKETFGKFSSEENIPVTFEGRTQKGGGINILSYDNITWHYGVSSGQVGGQTSDPDIYWQAREVDNLELLEVLDDEVVFHKRVSEEENVAIWADITVNGVTYTTNRNYLRIFPNQVLSNHIVPEVTSGDGADKLTDNRINSSDGGNTSRWTPEKEDDNPAITLDLKSVCDLSNISVYFNNKDRYYMNTPKAIRIETSEDGENWETPVEQGEVPDDQTKYRYESDKHTYTLNRQGRYLKISFPGGARADVMDVLEVRVRGINKADRLADVAVATKLIDPKTAAFHLTGISGTGEELDLSQAKIQIESSNPEIVAVNEQNQAVAVSRGRARIQVNVMLGGNAVGKQVYLDVNSEGNLESTDFLARVNLTADTNKIAVGSPAVARIEALYDNGKPADLSNAEIKFLMDSDNLTVVEGTSVITMKESIPLSSDSSIQVQVTVDGITVDSNIINLTQTGDNVADRADVTVSSVRDRNGNPNGSNQDDRYLGVKTVDGDRQTAWAARGGDLSPWIELDFGEEQVIASLNLIDRGHKVNEIGEGKLEFVDKSGELVHEQTVSDIKWDGQPDNIVKLEQPVHAQKFRFTIDPELKYYHGENGEIPERGLAEIQVALAADVSETYIVSSKPVYAAVNIGVQPNLPAAVTAVFNDGTQTEREVNWDAIPQENLKEAGIFHVQGRIDGTEVKALAEIKVHKHVNVTGVSVDPAKITMTQGDNTVLKAVIVPQNATNQAVRWDSDNKSVATVDASGRVTAVSKGSAKITAMSQDGNKAGICNVTVLPKEVPPPIKHTVTLAAAGGQVTPSTILVPDGKPYGALPVPTRSGYKFIGWYKGNQAVKSSDICNVNVTLTAKWEIIIEKPGKVTGLKASKLTTSSIKLSWKKVPQATSYKVYRYDTKKNRWKSIKTTKSASYTDSKKKPGTKYKYRVAACNSKGNGSYSSTFNTATRPLKPKLKVTLTGTNKAKLTWKKISAYKVQVYMKTGKGKYKRITTRNGKSVSYTKSGLKKGKTYEFKIRGYMQPNSKTKIYGSYSSLKKVIINKK